jgi:predicted SAM-dependent methyltransferase
MGSVKTAFKTYLNKRISMGARFAFRVFLNEWELSRLHHRQIRKVPQFLRLLPAKLNLGCGPNRKAGWVNIDLFDSGADLQLDLREAWPFPDGSISYIYSEHVFEHFEFHHEVPAFLSQALRVLEPGGVFDVVVPDTETALKAYRNPTDQYWSTSAAGWHPDWCETELDHINYHFYQFGEHKYSWDAETLTRTLCSAGFVSVAKREFNPLLDSESRRAGSLYMMAKKP